MDLVTSVPSRTPSNPPTTQELLNLFEEKNKKLKLNKEKSNKYSHNKILSHKKKCEISRLFDDDNNFKNDNDDDNISVKKDLKYYLYNLPPPCSRCKKESKRLGADVTWKNCVTDNENIVISSRPYSHRKYQDKECSLHFDSQTPRNVLYGLNRCRQLLLRNAHLLSRYCSVTLCLISTYMYL